MLSLMHVYILVYLYVQFSLDFARTLHGVFDSMRKKESIPTHHRPVEHVSLICTIKSLFLDQLDIKHIFKHRVWKKFVRKNKGSGQWKEELNARMNFPVCALQKIC